ncbi:hypothetical protein DICVIV_01570 [Dictyocaulus viviparus]|uniref:Receptor ligand binding region domain-containing protein n=1 Tax=Dictyocaulus viviparus TaxID=29172 RepID=A0A0D8Y7T7_DICVI|nr:hypothetical protein DICVIV_01570 [Dictyocaulus viviparus]
MDKLWISLPIDGRVLDSSEQSELLASGAKIEVYNCSDIKCDVEKQETEQRFSSTLSIEAVIRMAYAFAAVGHKIASDAEKQKKWSVFTHPAPECTSLIIREFLALDYQFGINDPSEFIGKRLNFYRDRENIILASGMTVVARELSISNGKFTDHQMMSYTTGQQPTVTLSSMRRADQRKRSLCNPYRPFCGQCQNVELVNSERYYLSIPRHYPMYLIGLFDFHSGSSCQTMSTTDISLPMAFIHAVWTFKQRFSDMILLKNFDFGALLVDSCSSGKQAIEIVVTAETQCIRFNHADRNITIVPGSALGYVSALHESTEEALKGYFSSEDSDATLVTVDSDSTPRHAYSAFPSAINQALALLKFIKRMRWQFVSVALNEQHTESLVIFRHFERLALDRGVCLGEVVFATALDASAYLSLTLRSHRNVVHVMMGDAHDWYLHNPENTKHFKGIFSIQPKKIHNTIKAV